jgi:hypothetical protein
LLALSVVGSMMAIGAAYPSILVAAAIPIALAIALALRMASPRTHLRLSGPAVALGLLAAYTLLQAVPLPMGLLGKIAASNADIWSRALLPFAAAGPSWASISLDPGASFVEVLKWLVYAGVFVLSAWMSARRGAEWGVILVFGSALLLSLVTLGHGLVGATTVFGIYKPHVGVAPWHMSPLLNPNNLAGYLNLGAMCGLGLLVARRSLFPRWMLALGVATIVGVDLVSASRGGFLVLPLGVGLFAALQRAPKGERADNASRKAFPWLLTAAVGGGAILAVLGGTAATWQELYDKNLDKLAIVGWTKPMIRDHLWFGIGRGAFESVFPAYQTVSGNLTFTHAENFPAQWTSEWGVPVAFAAMAAFAWFFRPSGMGMGRSSITTGAWVGVLIVLVQNLLDLALELPAVSMAMATALGSIWGDHRRRRVSKATEPTLQWSDASPLKKVSIAALTLAFLVASAATCVSGVHEVGRDKDELYSSLTHLDVRDPAAAQRFRADLRAAMLRHPAEPYFPLLGATLAVATRDTNPIPWLQRTLERGSINGPAHLLLAEILLAKRAVNQALMELRFAVSDDPNLAGITAIKALSCTRQFDELMRYVPAGPKGALALESLAGALRGAEDADLRERIHREALNRDPSRPAPHLALANEVIQRIAAKDAGTCFGDAVQACEDEVLRHVTAIETALPNRSDADHLRARLLAAKGRAEEGERLLAQRCDHVEDRSACLQARLQIAAQIQGPRALAAAAKETLAGCGSSTECAAIATWIGDTMAARGDWGGAAAYYTRSTSEEGTESRWLKVAQATSHLGSHAQAAEALQRVGQLRGHVDPDLAAQIQAERAKALGLLDK